MTIKGIGTIKSAAEQASTDANTISNLKARVEAQSATVDLIAKEAADAKQLVDDLSEKNSKAEEKLSQIDKSISDGNLAVKELQLLHNSILQFLLPRMMTDELMISSGLGVKTVHFHSKEPLRKQYKL